MSESHARRPPPPPLPTPLTFEVPGVAIIKYIDVKPPHYEPATTPTIVLIHGSPGSYKDFRYLVPLLQSHARVVALNLPGFDDSVVTDEANRFEHVTASGVAQIAYDMLTQVCRDAQHVFLIGHSFGGHTVINIAAMNLKRSKLHIKGIALLSSAGGRPQGTSRPISMGTVSMLIRSRLPFVSSVGQSLAHSMYTAAGLKDDAPAIHFASAMVRCMTTDYAAVTKESKAIAHIPAFVAWTRDDHLIEEAIFVEMSEMVGPGPRVAFDNGSHYIQRTKARELGPALVHWIDTVVSSGSGADTGGGDSVETSSVSSDETLAPASSEYDATTYVFTARAKL